jgi:hypothetical protein
MNEISNGPFSIVLDFLNYKNITNFKGTSKTINNDIEKFSVLYRKKFLVELWGKNITTILMENVNIRNDKKYENFTSYNHKSYIRVLSIIYDDFFKNNKISFKSGLFIDIYNVYYIAIARDKLFGYFIKQKFLKHLTSKIRKYIPRKDMNFDNAQLKSIWGVTSYLHRYTDNYSYRDFVIRLL